MYIVITVVVDHKKKFNNYWLHEAALFDFVVFHYAWYTVLL